jgi:hypothetical protein
VARRKAAGPPPLVGEQPRAFLSAAKPEERKAKPNTQSRQGRPRGTDQALISVQLFDVVTLLTNLDNPDAQRRLLAVYRLDTKGPVPQQCAVCSVCMALSKRAAFLFIERDPPEPGDRMAVGAICTSCYAAPDLRQQLIELLKPAFPSVHWHESTLHPAPGGLQ